jgi:uncharacterized protein (UPF0332 family)
MHYGGIPIAFNWREYLILAIELENGTDEAKLRSSISRAYYAAYCSAKNYMEGPCKRTLPPRIPTHQYVIDYYNGNKGHETNHRRSQIAQNLMRMRDKRRMADYDNEIHPLKQMHSETQFVLELSEDVIALIEQGGL